MGKVVVVKMFEKQANMFSRDIAEAFKSGRVWERPPPPNHLVVNLVQP